jgi:hypothetical protein
MSQGGESARADLKGGAGWMLLGLVILVASWRMDRFEAMGATLYTAPGLVPGIFGLGLIVLGALLAWRGWRTARTEQRASVPLLNRRMLGMFGLTFTYAAGLVGRAPFTVSTALFVAVFTWLYADTTTPARRLLIAAGSGLLTALAMVLVFERLFLVRLP